MPRPKKLALKTEAAKPLLAQRRAAVDGSNTKAKRGTDLGLAIARQIVEMHGGRIWVEIDSGYRLEFKCAADPCRDAKASALSKKRILVVTD